MANLFEKYGGFETITKLVHEFYKKLLADDKVSKYFFDTDMDLLMEHQVRFLSMALGGPNGYTGRELKTAHENLNITNDHFNLVASYLEEVLDEANVEESDIKEILGIVGSVRPDIVSA